MYHYESLIKSAWKTEQKMFWKKKNMKNCIEKTKFSKKKKLTKINLKNMPDCGR